LTKGLIEASGLTIARLFLYSLPYPACSSCCFQLQNTSFCRPLLPRWTCITKAQRNERQILYLVCETPRFFL